MQETNTKHDVYFKSLYEHAMYLDLDPTKRTL